MNSLVNSTCEFTKEHIAFEKQAIAALPLMYLLCKSGFLYLYLPFSKILYTKSCFLFYLIVLNDKVLFQR